MILSWLFYLFIEGRHILIEFIVANGLLDEKKRCGDGVVFKVD